MPRKKAGNYMDSALPFNKILLFFFRIILFAAVLKENRKGAFQETELRSRSGTGLDMITALNTHCPLSIRFN
jgi:hypothetical protein